MWPKGSMVDGSPKMLLATPSVGNYFIISAIDVRCGADP
jgi:hypothetical protein